MQSLSSRFFKTALWMVVLFALAVTAITLVILLAVSKNAPDALRVLNASLKRMSVMKNNAGTKIWIYGAIWAGLVITSVAAVGIALLVVLSRSVIRPLNALKRSAQSIRDGDLEDDVLLEQDQEFFEVSVALDDVRRRLKANAAASVKAQEERNMLAANISHDLRTPVTTIRGYLEGIRDGVADTPEKQKRYWDTIYAKTLALERVVDSMTEYAELELGRMQYHFAPMDLTAFLQELSGEYAMDVQSAGYAFAVSLPEGKAELQGDAGKLRRVLDNLISNAIKYNNPGGSVRFTAKRVTEGLPEGMRLGMLISVQDTGIGISESESTQVFNGFYRGEQVRSGKIKGSGLGLAIARQIVERHHGRIWLKSREGEGTEACVLLPLWEQNEAGGEDREDTGD